MQRAAAALVAWFALLSAAPAGIIQASPPGAAGSHGGDHAPAHAAPRQQAPPRLRPPDSAPSETVTRPAPALGPRPSPSLVTRPAPPLQKAPSDLPQRHERSFFFGPPFFYGPGFGYPYGEYPYGGYWRGYGPQFFDSSAAFGVAPPAIDAPFYCWLDGSGFEDEETFARHLHDVHRVPLENALSFTESVGGRHVFFGN